MWISLIGLDGAGKRTLARLLARVSAREAVELATARARPAASHAAGDLVVVTAADALADPALAGELTARGLVVWLDAPWPVLRRRLCGAAGSPPDPVWARLGEGELRRRHARWRPLYARAARLRLDSGRHGPSALARRLLARTLQLQEPAA